MIKNNISQDIWIPSPSNDMSPNKNILVDPITGKFNFNKIPKQKNMVTPLNEDQLFPIRKQSKITKFVKNLFYKKEKTILNTKLQQNIDTLETQLKTKYSKEYKTVLKQKIKKQKLQPSLIYSALVTPDGTKIESVHRHDYKTYFDTINFKTYMIDGGLDYIKRSNHGDEKVISFDNDNPHEIVRLYAFRTGCYGDSQSENYGLTRVCYMSDSYLQASIEYFIKYKQYNNHLNVLLDEQIYRMINNVTNIVNLDFEVIG